MENTHKMDEHVLQQYILHALNLRIIIQPIRFAVRKCKITVTFFARQFEIHSCENTDRNVISVNNCTLQTFE